MFAFVFVGFVAAILIGSMLIAVMALRNQRRD